MNAPEIRSSALESDSLAAMENLQSDMVNLPMSLVLFPSLNGDEAWVALFFARWSGVEKT